MPVATPEDIDIPAAAETCDGQDRSTDREPEPALPAAPEPILSVRDFGLVTRRGSVFSGLDLDLHPGTLTLLTGPAGAGRTSALLALSGRFRTNRGSRTGPAKVALGLVPGVHEPDPGLTIAEHIGERLRLLGKARSRHRRPDDDRTLVCDLAPLDRHRLMLRLALLEEPDVIAVDDIDVGLTPTESGRLLSELVAAGPAVVAVARTMPSGIPLPATHTTVEVTR